jgi:hypothetical protein
VEKCAAMKALALEVAQVQHGNLDKADRSSLILALMSKATGTNGSYHILQLTSPFEFAHIIGHPTLISFCEKVLYTMSH